MELAASGETENDSGKRSKTAYDADNLAGLKVSLFLIKYIDQNTR